MKAILFKQYPWNTYKVDDAKLHKNIVRVKDWHEVEDAVEAILK